MHRLRRPLLGALILLGLGLAAALAATVVQVDRATSPPRQHGHAIDFESVLMRVEEVGFVSGDGVDLRGWLIRGDPELPAIVLCHDHAQSKGSLINLAIELRRAGFTILAFDFRAHGASAGTRSTLGLLEKRDVVGAVDYLQSLEGIEGSRIGVYGVGMGAHAAVLAAAARPRLKVLVLDGLYPDASYALVRRAYPEWVRPRGKLALLPGGVFTLLSGASIVEDRAADAIGALEGRDLLLLAPAADSTLTGEMRRMVERIPEQPDVDGNLVVLPATHGDGLYGQQLGRYHERVAEFFRNRLPRT